MTCSLLIQTHTYTHKLIYVAGSLKSEFDRFWNSLLMLLSGTSSIIICESSTHTHVHTYIHFIQTRTSILPSTLDAVDFNQHHHIHTTPSPSQFLLFHIYLTNYLVFGVSIMLFTSYKHKASLYLSLCVRIILSLYDYDHWLLLLLFLSFIRIRIRIFILIIYNYSTTMRERWTNYQISDQFGAAPTVYTSFLVLQS